MDNNDKINTGGGSFIKGEVNSQGDFVGRDIKTTTLNTTTLSRNLTVSGSLIVAVVAVLLVGIVGITAIVNANRGEAMIPPMPTMQAAKSFTLMQTSDTRTGTPSPSSQVEQWQACTNQYFADVKRKEWTSVEVGAYDQPMTFSVQNQVASGFIGPLGVELTENAQPLAAIKFNLVASGRLIKITSVVNGSCQAIEEYSDTTRPGKHTLQDFDALRIQLAAATYDIRFKWAGGDSIQFDFQRVN